MLRWPLLTLVCILLLSVAVNAQQKKASRAIAVPIPPCVEQFNKLPEVAERLGVKPNTGDGSIKMTMCDGRTYDAFALINALLDRLDRSTK